MRRAPGVAFLFLLFALFSAAQKPLELTVDTIMRGPGLTGYAPRDVRWSRDSKQVYFGWKRYSDPVEENELDTYAVSRDGSGLRKLSAEEAKDRRRGREGPERQRLRGVAGNRSPTTPGVSREHSPSRPCCYVFND